LEHAHAGQVVQHAPHHGIAYHARLVGAQVVKGKWLDDAKGFQANDAALAGVAVILDAVHMVGAGGGDANPQAVAVLDARVVHGELLPLDLDGVALGPVADLFRGA